jgi:hypothetical protein
MIINVKNVTDSTLMIRDLGNVVLNPNTTTDIGAVRSLADIAESDDLIEFITSSKITVNNGDRDLSTNEAVKYVTAHNVLVEYRDRSGKLRVHQTSRKLGTRIMWTGIGDDPSDITKVGGGETLSFQYKVGDIDPMIKYIDFNVAENETWLHEGYLTWQGGQMDTLSLQMVPRTVTVSGTTGSDMTVYGGYLVVPTPPGGGNYVVTSDLTQPAGGLVYMPDNDLGESPTAYWDADYNEDTHEYENIRPNYTAQGRYNIFSYEVVFAEFMRQIPFLGSGFIPLNSSDTDQLGQGMRLKMIADTNTSVADHDWSIACIMCLHRDHSI